MEEEEGINMRERQEALAKFRQTLSQPLTERYYDEDELIDYFDFASDFNDDYLRMEVLICAARFYPNSEELLERKAIFYSQFSDEVMEKCVEDNAQSTGIIWDIMRARNSMLTTSEAQIETLDTILSTYDQFNDEEIIQFVGLVNGYDKIKWLKDHLDILQKKAMFPAVLLYETAVVAEMSGDTDYAINMLERLTDLEPFNSDFWLVLSKEYAKAEQYDKSMSALEYAIAIDPENTETLYQKARLLYRTGGNYDEILTLLKKIEELDGLDREILRVIGLILKERGEISRVPEIYERFVERHPDQAAEVLLDMITFMPTEAQKILDRIYSIDDDISHWLIWAQEFESMGLNNLAARVIITYFNKTPVLEPPFTMVELAFRLGLFELTDILMTYYISHDHNPLQDGGMDQQIDQSAKKDIRFYTIAIITKLKLGKMDDVATLLPELSQTDLLSSPADVNERATIMGYSYVFTTIFKILSENDTDFDWGQFDPFGFWSTHDTSEPEKTE